MRYCVGRHGHRVSVVAVEQGGREFVGNVGGAAQPMGRVPKIRARIVPYEVSQPRKANVVQVQRRRVFARPDVTKSLIKLNFQAFNLAYRLR